MPKKGRGLVLTSFFIEPDQLAALEEIKAVYNLSYGEVIRQALTEHIARLKRKPGEIRK